MKKFVFGFAFVVVSIWVLLNLDVQHKVVDPLAVDNAYIRAMIPGQDTTAAFFTIANHSQESCALLRAESPVAERVEFHTHQHMHGMMKMRPVDEVEVPAGKMVSFEPGGLHLMLFGVEFNHDKAAQINLHTDHCGSFSFSAPLTDMRSKPTQGMHH